MFDSAPALEITSLFSKAFFLSAEYHSIRLKYSETFLFLFLLIYLCVTFPFLEGYAPERCKKEIYPKEYKETFPLAVASGVTGWNVIEMCTWNTRKYSSQINNHGESRIRILWYILDICISADTLGVKYILACHSRIHESKLRLNLLLGHPQRPQTKSLCLSIPAIGKTIYPLL